MRVLSRVERIARLAAHAGAVAAGAVGFRITTRTPARSYLSMRALYCLTNGRSNELLSRLLEKPPSTVTAPVNGVLGALTPSQVEEIAAEIRRVGYYIFPTLLPPETCDELTRFAQQAPGRLLPRRPEGPERAVFDPERPLAIKYDLEEKSICAQPAVQKLLTDQGLLSVAERYLNCQPLNDLVAMWWSTAAASTPNSEVAQLFHFDMDRLKFLKFFFYLTDVGTDNGPHCYVEGSHRVKPEAVRRDGRHTDEAIAKAYDPSKIRELTGPRGSIMAVDTSGFHKGKHLTKGHRLILQFEFTNSFFGQQFKHIDLPGTPMTSLPPPYDETFKRFRRG